MPTTLLPLPTQAVAAVVPPTGTHDIPPTFTLPPATAVPTLTATPPPRTRIPTDTPLPIPTHTPVTPTKTPVNTPTPAPEGYVTATPDIKPIDQYGPYEVIPYQAFPTPPGDNGWGMHWMANTSQDRGVVDRFVAELVKMHIKWVVFLNDGADIGGNDYLVDKLVANGIMPVMRLYRSGVQAYDGNIYAMVSHYRAKGVYYYQLYNEPNVNIENHQGFANPNQYAQAWAASARAVISAGGLPGIGSFSPGGEYNHYEFLGRTLNALAYNGDAHLLNHAWLSVHNYHGLRPYDDPGGFLLFRNYDEIVRSHIGRSLPMIGTEGGSYSPDPNVETQFIAQHYSYMRNAEPYFLAYSSWLLANKEGGHYDESWEWQTLFRPGFIHPAVTEFFYKNSR
ncbi:MAG: hypothetical protein GY803_24385 [Chloroflexi bacterium]|nr:hypothetical protein [Chloroflexota bacterium]